MSLDSSFAPHNFNNIRKLTQLYSQNQHCCSHTSSKINNYSIQIQKFWENYHRLYHAYQKQQQQIQRQNIQIRSLQRKGRFDNIIDNSSYNQKILCPHSNSSSFSRFRNREILTELNKNHYDQNCSNQSWKSGSCSHSGQSISWKLQKTQQNHHSQQILLLQEQINMQNSRNRELSQQIQNMKQIVRNLQSQTQKQFQLAQQTMRKYNISRQSEKQWQRKYNACLDDKNHQIQQYSILRSKHCHLQSSQIKNKQCIQGLLQQINKQIGMGTSCCHNGHSNMNRTCCDGFNLKKSRLSGCSACSRY